MIVVALMLCAAMLFIFTVVYSTRLKHTSASDKVTPPASGTSGASTGLLVIVNNKAVHVPEHAVIRTSKGDITLQLLFDAAPRHVHNFVSLARSGWYNGTSLCELHDLLAHANCKMLNRYRLEKGFCLQGGGWPNKDGATTVPLETQMYAQYPNKKWAVSAARTSDPNSARAEFSIMLADNSKWLGPGGSDAHGYSVFGNVVGGQDVVETIQAESNVKLENGLNYLRPAIPILSIDA
jgi:peptidyl-prolyl cis-trans isomerase B (cyclophilin B)